jgi:hypothetical protein
MLPEKGIPLRVARDWATYERKLATTPLVHKYVGEILKGWVENPRIQNPLALPWLRILIDGNLSFLEQILVEFESDMGESNLSRLIPDLLPTSAPLQHTSRCLSALFGEVMTFRKLKELGATDIKKLTTWGDWQANGLTISVKSILDIDKNYELIEDVVEGLACLEEYPMVRATNHFWVFHGEGLDDKFIEKILGFLHSDLEELLTHLVSGMGYPRWAYSSVEALRIPEVAKNSERGRFLVKATRHNHKEILVVLEDIGVGDSPEQQHRVELKLELRPNASHEFATSNDFNAWSGEPDVDQEKLGRQIASKLNTLKAKNKGKDTTEFAAWINIEAHPSLQPGIAGHPERIRDLVSELLEGISFPVFVYIYGGFELAKPLLLRFGPDVDRFPRLGTYS